MSFLKMDPNLELHEVPIFKWTGITFIIGAIMMAIVIACNSNLKFDPSFIGFNFAFFTVFKVPLSFLATGIIAIGVIATFHRSSQTALQINKSTEQNTFTNFFKHRQEYLDHFKDKDIEMPPHISKSITNKVMKEYYIASFPQNTPEGFSLIPESEWLNNFDQRLVNLCSILLAAQQNNNSNITIMLLGIYSSDEARLMKDLFKISHTDKDTLLPKYNSSVTITFEGGDSRSISITRDMLSISFTRLKELMFTIIKLRNYADDKNESILSKSDEYLSLLMLENHNSLIPSNKNFNIFTSVNSSMRNMSNQESIELTDIIRQINKKHPVIL